jgi:hypothetical protein
VGRLWRLLDKLSCRTIAGAMGNTSAHANSFYQEDVNQHKKGFSD